MAQVEVTRDLFAHHNPLRFKKHPQGKNLYWANRTWRADRKGWGQLKPVKTSDTDWEEIKECLTEAPLDVDLHADHLVRRGDLVLCVQTQKAFEEKQLRRDYLANRKVKALQAGYDPVTEELSRLGGSEYLEREKPEFEHRSHTTLSQPAIKSGVAKVR